MKDKFNATCSICGKPYNVCSSCKETISYTPWRTITDTIDCYKIYMILTSYRETGNKADARENLLKYTLDELDTYPKHIKFAIKEILKEDKSENRKTNITKVVKNSKKIDSELENNEENE